MSRRFANNRPSHSGLRLMTTHSPRGNEQFRPLPPPTGKPPFRLNLEDVIGKAAIEEIEKAGQLSFHMVGDTGGIKDPKPQQVVALKMEEDVQQSQDTKENPSFFYHLGDVVYYNGESSKYYDQFYYPYENYNRPIFAIPGNHDGASIDPSVPSLQAFVDNFCAAQAVLTPEAGDTPRTAMTQPNVYFTLLAPFVTIVGLYTNVVEGGRVEDDQKEWFINELREASPDKALIVTMHHPIYSADDHHSGSQAMYDLLEEAVAESGRLPDAVFGAHVHNYQRFTRAVDDREVPFIVAGGGGYWHLHYVGKLPDGSPVATPAVQPELGVTLESYQDDHHGFLKLTVSADALGGAYYSAPRPQDSFRRPAERFDSFKLDLKSHKLDRSFIG